MRAKALCRHERTCAMSAALMGSERGEAPLRTKNESGMCHSASFVVRLTRAKRLCAQNAVTASNARVTFGRIYL